MIKKFQKELNAGTVSLVILAMLERSEDPMYGYQIAKSLEKSALGDKTTVKQGTLYPVLRSMERVGLLESRVEPSISGPPRKYYTITQEGRTSLGEWVRVWQHTRDFVDAILERKTWPPEKGQEDVADD